MYLFRSQGPYRHWTRRNCRSQQILSQSWGSCGGSACVTQSDKHRTDQTHSPCVYVAGSEDQQCRRARNTNCKVGCDLLNPLFLGLIMCNYSHRLKSVKESRNRKRVRQLQMDDDECCIVPEPSIDGGMLLAHRWWRFSISSKMQPGKQPEK